MISGAGHQTQFPLISMQNLLETYAKSSNSSHISVESDKQPVSVDVDGSSMYSETASENFPTTSTNF